MEREDSRVKLHLGIKSDPVEYRYSYEWLFRFMHRKGLKFLQLGSFFELYHLSDAFFIELRDTASAYGVRIKSCFTAHRELGGFFTGNHHLESVARRCYERFIEVASLVGADYVGSNPGAIYRDNGRYKISAIACYTRHMNELSHIAGDHGLSGLTLEPMSSLFEPPTTPDEITSMIAACRVDRTAGVPVYICGDISHGLIDHNNGLVYGHERLFEHAIPWMAEFHFKNTDSSYNSTFGFGSDNDERGIVDLGRIRQIVYENESAWPVEEVVGYLEIGGPKLGRDYSDPLLESQLEDSVDGIRAVFHEV